MTEAYLYEQVEQWLRLKHPGVPHHWDLSGVWTPSHKARNLYGRLNQRAWPDLAICRPHGYGGFNIIDRKAGMFLELKREGTRLRKKNGEWASEHIAEQAAVLESLAAEGYIAQFAVGFDDATQLIDSYLGARA